MNPRWELALEFVKEHGFGVDGLSVRKHTFNKRTILSGVMITTLMTVITLASTLTTKDMNAGFREYLKTAADINGVKHTRYIFSTDLACCIFDTLNQHVDVAVHNIVHHRKFDPLRIAQALLTEIFHCDLQITPRPRQCAVKQDSSVAQICFIDTEPCVMPEAHIEQFEEKHLSRNLLLADEIGHGSIVSMIWKKIIEIPTLHWVKATNKTFIATDPTDGSLWRREVCHSRNQACMSIRGLIFQMYIHMKTKLSPEIQEIALSRTYTTDGFDAIYVYAKTTKMISLEEGHKTFFDDVTTDNFIPNETMDQLIQRIATMHSTIFVKCRLIVCDTASKNCVYAEPPMKKQRTQGS